MPDKSFVEHLRAMPNVGLDSDFERQTVETTTARKDPFVDCDVIVANFRAAPAIDAELFRRDLDAVVDQSIEPRVQARPDV